MNQRIKGQTTCRCGCQADVTEKILEVARNLATSLDCEIQVTSGARCWKHHKKIYDDLGRPVTTNSYHLLGQALDIKCIRKDGSCIKAGLIIDEVKRMFGNQIWVYAINDTTVHIDVRGFK
jgi:uncharacterized protein YcbK (DUF882 family)